MSIQNQIGYKILKFINYPFVSRHSPQIFIQNPYLRRKTFYKNIFFYLSFAAYALGKLLKRKQIHMVGLTFLGCSCYLLWKQYELKLQGKYQDFEKINSTNNSDKSLDLKNQALSKIVYNYAPIQNFQKPKQNYPSKEIPQNVKTNSIQELIQSLPKQYYLK